jgi:hypothetical protein
VSLLWIEHSTSRFRSIEPKFAAQGGLLQSGALPSELKRHLTYFMRNYTLFMIIYKN